MVLSSADIRLYNEEMEHLWIALALVSAFALATSDALTKKALALHNEYLIAWLRLVLTLPVLFVTLLFIPVPPLDASFFRAFFAALPLEIASVILYVKALKLSPLSLTLPFLSLTPVFLIVLPRIVLGEEVSALGAFGILCIAAGGYLLNIRDVRKGILEPVYAIARERGVVCMIIVAVIYSFTSTLGKMAIVHSSALFFAVTYFTALVIAFTPVALYKGRSELRGIIGSGAITASVLPGLFYAAMIISHMIAMSLTQVAYMISVKRLSLIFGVIYGYVLFRESGIRERLAGTALMIAGFALIILFH